MNKKKGVRIIVLLFLAVLIPVTFTAVSASGEDVVKIGYVDLRVALNESEAGKKAKIELESLIKTKQSSIEERGKSLERLKGDFEKQASVLSADARKSKEEEIERLMRDYQRLVQDSQNDVKKKEGDITGSILKELRDVVQKIGQEEGYSVILENVEGMILYSRKDLDITEKVIKNYNDWKAKQKK
ncbi:MAG TPA: OmpH family outer membrane protein [Thermodesulfovibrionales bacterium]|nr:OmpH family outer membrane protein [Thermodesulfovibrionales bacterium]